MQATTINDVVRCLDVIIDECHAAGLTHGYFACLYRKMTVGIQQGIAQGAFEDNARMEKLDVIFANRYLDAYEEHAAGLPSTSCWKTTFDAAQNNKLIVLQHLLLGINAHINLDLGIAAAHTSSKETILALQRDFDKVNEIIAALFEEVQTSLSKIAIPMIFIRKINPQQLDAVLNFSIQKARQTSWANALLLCEAGPAMEADIIDTTDRVVCKVAAAICNPGTWASALVKLVRYTEQKDVRKNIDFLR